jgi:hypothetical protein
VLLGMLLAQPSTCGSGGDNGGAKGVRLPIDVQCLGRSDPLGFLGFFVVTVLGMHASYRRMEMGGHYPEDWGRPDQGTREGGVPDSV